MSVSEKYRMTDLTLMKSDKRFDSRDNAIVM